MSQDLTVQVCYLMLNNKMLYESTLLKSNLFFFLKLLFKHVLITIIDISFTLCLKYGEHYGS